ncbi:MAG TPA: lysoplasmalogenase, partial [Anaerolineales bacterium]|nr:lysoplasmalogenase [Anaerolineales bacterium]
MLILSLAVVLSSSLTILAAYLGPSRRWLFYCFKPITTILIIGVALLPGTALSERYAGAISLGLLFSLMGDIWLMLPGDRFRQGLASFLVARLWYIYAFAAGAATGSFPWALMLFSIIAITALRYLWPALPGRLKVAVGVYVGVTVLSTALPAALYAQSPTGYTLAAAVGAVLFLVSDLILAVDRFRRPFWIAHGLVLATYF